MVLGPKLPDLLDQLFLRVLDVNLVDALRVLDSCRTPLARLVAITLGPCLFTVEAGIARNGSGDSSMFG